MDDSESVRLLVSCYNLLKAFSELPIQRVDFEAADYYGFELEKIANSWAEITGVMLIAKYPDIDRFSRFLWDWLPEEEKSRNERYCLKNLAAYISQGIELDLEGKLK